MRRRTFLGLLGALAAAPRLPRAAAAPVDRLTWWDPAPPSTSLGTFVALEWRYLAGRITRPGADFGFVVSMADYNPIPPPLNLAGRNELLVMRQEFTGAQAHATTIYPGTLSYDAPSATYSFVGDNPAVTATWRLDTAAQRYTLSVASPELALADLLVSPVGDLIPEGGAGLVKSGTFTVEGVAFPLEAISDYYADWATLSEAGAPVGVGRLDMQTIRPQLGGSGSAQFSHHWFALAATLADDTPAWVSGWQIVTGATTSWGVTIARGAGAGWSVSSVGSDAGFAGRQPLAVTILEYQDLPGGAEPRRTGRRWRLRAGQAADGDLLDLDIAVPPGQFISGARISVASGALAQESVAAGGSGLVGGKGIKDAQLAVVESSFYEPGAAPAPAQRLSLPLLRR